MGERAHSGRRPGVSGTRAAIEAAARRQFAELGYDRTSLRQVAIEAGVDPGLVTHYYGAKPQLFRTVVELPFEPAAMAAAVVPGDRAEVGLRLARFVLGVLEDETGRRRVVGLVRAAASEPEAARIIRDLVTSQIIVPIAEQLDVPDPAYRAGLVMSQIVGLTMARYVVGIEPLASRPAAGVAADLAGTLQRYLAGDLGAG
jgi:AcrR family transcriptional regulator